MRILMLSQFFHPEPIVKGLPFARGLAALGHQVEVVTGFPNYPSGTVYPGYRVRVRQRELVDGIPVLRLPLFPCHDTSAIRRAANYLSFGLSAALLAPLQIAKPDIVYVRSLITLGLAARLSRWIHGCPVVLDVQDLWPDSVTASGMMKSQWLGGVLERWCRHEYAMPDHITVLSPGLKQRLVERGVRREKIEVIYNWCDETPAAGGGESRDLREAYRFAGRFNVVFAGTMGRVQGLDTILAAAAMIRSRRPEVMFTFLGSGVELGRLKTLARGIDNVQFLPECPPAEAMRVMGMADGLLVHLKDHPLSTVTIPSKTQTCLYAARPVLMGVRGDAAELIRRSGAGLLFEPGAPESLVAAIEALIAMPAAERRVMGQRGRAYYESHLSFAHGLRRFDHLFHAVAAPRLERSWRLGLASPELRSSDVRHNR